MNFTSDSILKHLDKWEGAKFHIPVYTSSVEIVARILETKNLALCKSQSARNLGVDWMVFE